MYELANQLIKKALEENATYLDLGNCGLIFYACTQNNIFKY